MIDIDKNNNHWQINCDLTFDNVRKIAKKYKNYNIGNTTPWKITVAKDIKIDSSGFALLISYVKYSKEHNIILNIRGIEQKYLKLADVMGIKSILEKHLI